MNKRNLKMLTLIVLFIAGGLFGKYLYSRLGSNGSVGYSPDYLVMSRDLNTYTGNADTIVIGKITKITAPYFRQDRGITPQQDATLEVQEVLKGDPKTSNITISGVAPQMEGFTEKGDQPSFKDAPTLLTPQENVLLFLGTNSWGEHVVFAGPYGKYLLDSNNLATSVGDFSMPLDNLKQQITEALKNPVRPNIKVPPISEEI